MLNRLAQISTTIAMNEPFRLLRPLAERGNQCKQPRLFSEREQEARFEIEPMPWSRTGRGSLRSLTRSIVRQLLAQNCHVRIVGRI